MLIRVALFAVLVKKFIHVNPNVIFYPENCDYGYPLKSKIRFMSILFYLCNVNIYTHQEEASLFCNLTRTVQLFLVFRKVHLCCMYFVIQSILRVYLTMVCLAVIKNCFYYELLLHITVCILCIAGTSPFCFTSCNKMTLTSRKPAPVIALARAHPHCIYK